MGSIFTTRMKKSPLLGSYQWCIIRKHQNLKMVYCDVCKMNHRQLLVEGVYYKDCLKRWFISGKNMCMSFSAEYSEETYQKATTMISLFSRENI